MMTLDFWQIDWWRTLLLYLAGVALWAGVFVTYFDEEKDSEWILSLVCAWPLAVLCWLGATLAAPFANRQPKEAPKDPKA